MSFEFRTVDDLMRIARAGGGFVLNAGSRTTDDLVRIASAGADAGARIVFKGVANRTTDDRVRIGRAGGGIIQFKG